MRRISSLAVLAALALPGAAPQPVLGLPRRLAILRAAALVPFLGFLVGLAAVIFGLGLIGAAIGAAREPQPARSPGS